MYGANMSWRSPALHLRQDMSISLGNWSPTIWLLTASAAIVTTNYVVHERHQHFPYHLLIPQLLVAIAIRLQRRALEHGWRDLWETIRDGCRRIRSPTSSHVWSFASTVLAVTSLFAAYQTFFHLQSVLCATLVLALSPACATSVCAFFSQPDRFTAARVSLLAICVFALLLNDYRVTPPGLAITLLALGTHIAAYFCEVQSRQIDSPDALDETDSEDGILCTLLAALLPALAAAYISETPGKVSFDPSMAPVVLSFNIVLGGIALANACSLFARPQAAVDGFSADMLSVNPPALVGLVFIVYGLTGRGIVISGWQVVAFVAAFLVGMTANSYTEDIETMFDQQPQPFILPTWRRVLGFDEIGDGRMGVGLHDNEPTSGDFATRRTAKCAGSLSPWQIVRVVLLSIAVIGWVCMFFGAISHSVAFDGRLIRPHPHVPSADPGSIDIVVSYHDESILKLASTLTSILQLPNTMPLTQRVILYAKASEFPASELQTNLSLALPPTVTVHAHEIPNIGREGETYLHHILDNYDDEPSGLADHTLFLQADMHDPWYMRPRIMQYFTPRTGFLSLWHTESICSSCSSCRDHSPTWAPSQDLLETVFHAANGANATCADIVPTYRGQFIASAPRIRANEKSMYEDLRRRFTDADEENPSWGYDLERLWGTVLQCAGSRSMGDRCPSMMSGMMGTVGALEDCQCLD
ncbi:hypothetical protein Q7P37_010736 [Cladosporium fusiforme]